MSTPSAAASAAKHPTPSQTAVTPRSVPSPALNRAHPAGYSVRTPQPSSATKGGTPMVPSLSQTSAASGGSGRGLGILGSAIKNEGVSPAHLGVGSVSSIGTSTGLLNFASPNAMAALEGIVMGTSGMGMGMGMPDLAAGKRDEAEERRRKVVGILGKLAGKDRTSRAGSGIGRISDEGVRRVGRWAGFDVEIENKYQGKDWEGRRPIVIAGRNAVLIDLAFNDNVVSKVEVTFTSEDEEVSAHQSGAAKVLKEDLTIPKGISMINTRLDRFASNLEALGSLDKLSTASVNCVEAVTGVYSSLKRLYDNEKKAAEALVGQDSKDRKRKIMDEVICRKSGRPGMHVHGRVGLSLDYWRGQAATKVTSARPANTETGLGITNAPSSDDGEKEHDSDDVYSLEFTVESNVSAAFPPIRISKEWIGKDVVKSADATSDPTSMMLDTSNLDWLEPPQTISKEIDAMATDNNTASTNTLPEVRFVARLRPPIVMPYAVATQILQSTGLPGAPTVEHASSYEATLLGLDKRSDKQNATVTPTDALMATRTRQIFVPRPDVERDVTQRTTLHVPKQELAFTLTEIPFAHPRQIVEILPVLRQWACLGQILRTAFMPEEGDVYEVSTMKGVQGRGKTSPRPVPVAVKRNGNKKIALEDFFPSSESSPMEDVQKASKVDPSVLPVDITLCTGTAASLVALQNPTQLTGLQHPSLTLFFPGTGAAGSAALGAVTLRVLPGGDIDVSGRGVSAASGADGESGMEVDTPGVRSAERLARGLRAVGWDLGVWVEWIGGLAGSSA
ncbi:hypothetical protein ANO11243_090660 [Dothideomycetidae sp. 11243]|nr:hypothetical protein ANO11243_090660 [fungal sp. No.11243]